MLIFMNFKKVAFSEPFLSHRRKVVISGFSLGVGATLLFFTLLLLSNSLKVPKVQVFMQGFDNVGANSSISSCPFSNKTNHSSSSVTSEIEEVNVVAGTLEVNVSGVGTNGTTMEAMPKGIDLTHLESFTENLKNESLHAVEQRNITENVALVTERGNFLHPNGQGKFSGKIGVGNSSRKAKDMPVLDAERRIAANTSFLGKGNMETNETVVGEPLKNSSFGPKMGSETNYDGNLSYHGKPVNMAGKYEGDLVGRKNATVIHNESQQEKIQVGLYESCDIFDGKWVRDDSEPYYPLGSCPYIDKSFDCHLNGRRDREYVKWKWKPKGCEIPSLNATDFLERLQGQRLVFVGDSLNRNMWESLICILRQSIRDKKRVFEISGRREFKKKGVYAFRFEDYNCSVDFVSSPFIVRESTFKGKNGSFETLRLDLMDQTTSIYQDADIVVFNTGHWWTHEKTSKGEDYYQEGNHVYPRLKVLDAYTRALTTWARWIDRTISANQTQIVFRGYSATHFWGGQWNSGGECHKETEPIFNETYLQKYPSKMRALENVIQKMKTPVIYMNISRLTDYRKDGHPSIFRMEYKTAAERNSAELYEDCSHWCLPGVPDTWNELLYASLLKYGKGNWKC